jgi:hypothetical protein
MLLANPVLTYLLLALNTKKGEERNNKRKKIKRKNHNNKVSTQDKRGTEKRERERERGGTYRARH